MERIKKYVEGFKGKRVAVAYSGGVDSSLIAFYTKGFADAILVRSELTPRYMQEKARGFARKFGINYRVLDMEILDKIKNNPKDRCYLCKRMIFQKIKSMGYEVVLDGTNADDLREDRPGLKANRDEGVYSPLAELGLGKKDVRKIMRGIDKELSLQPSETCLATRIPFESEITPARLMRIDKAEDMIRSLDVSRVRVRDHFPFARIQIPRKEFEIILDSRDLVQGLKSLGYEYITLDMEGME